MFIDMPHHQHLKQPAFMVICDGACDQICSTKREATKEAADLRKMGFEKVQVKSFETWADAHAYEDKLQEKN